MQGLYYQVALGFGIGIGKFEFMAKTQFVQFFLYKMAKI